MILRMPGNARIQSIGSARKSSDAAETAMPTTTRLIVEKRLTTGMSTIRPITIISGLIELTAPRLKSL